MIFVFLYFLGGLFDNFGGRFVGARRQLHFPRVLQDGVPCRVLRRNAWSLFASGAAVATRAG